MAAPSALAQLLPRVGLEDPSQAAALLEAERYSQARLREARASLRALDLRLANARDDHRGFAERGLAVFALGSLGRHEASPTSDLDLAVLYDGQALDPAEAQRLREAVVDVLSPDFDILHKTFDRAVDRHSLVANIGGREDSNLSLTYRALLLTEGAWLVGAGRATKRGIFRAYADGQISRGRFLASLGNDLQRYYRTLCMDYRHKVEVLDKSWALRVLKLRHSRKLWHLANIALQCFCVDAIEDDAARDVTLAARIGWPSLLRLATALDHFGAPELAREPVLCMDHFLAALADPAVRDELGQLPYEARHDSAVFEDLYANADRLDAATADIVELLLARCRRYMVRFCVL
ncbi:hypothetical protein PPSIR1_05063 [Plesiocystis pacifica SIR-1]|uniref:Uncharacterized protein n=1 Tax=Plesiocystis pacifica SIR-1 TaxID=391625 RepID=A6FWY5_9BACT|nr:DUF294 nucleotidyltransferase-like domain-containing protein [Plesiocystis pacifica]EDM81809.1 hypothetical protein PPSIR1_05063 [Plesiocystis pacifica SIR-1]